MSGAGFFAECDLINYLLSFSSEQKMSAAGFFAESDTDNHRLPGGTTGIGRTTRARRTEGLAIMRERREPGQLG